MDTIDKTWEERFEDLFNKKQDLIWEEALKDEFKDITASRDKYDSELNEQLDDLEDALKKKGSQEPYYYVKMFPRNLLWEDLSQEHQDLLYYMAWTLKEDYEKEGKSLGLEIKEMKKQRERDLLDNIERKEEELDELKSRLPKQEYDSIEDCSHEMVKRTNKGLFRSYRKAWRWALENCTINGERLKNLKQLSSAYERVCDSGKTIPITERMRRSLEED